MITGFLRHAETRPDAIALTIGHRDYTYAEAADIAARWAAGLIAITDGRPQRVAIFCAMDPIELLSPFAYLDRHGITVWFSVPSVATALLQRGALTRGRMRTLRWSLFCGEALTLGVAEAWQLAAPSSTVENLYGPTELTIACTVHRWHPRTSPVLCTRGIVPIGRPYPDMSELIVNADGDPVEDGGPGELWMTGPQMAPGYWRSPQVTAQRFVEHQGRTYYRTGDIVRRHTNGELIYLGRSDQQVKLRGHRVELGEIEATLRQAGSTDAVCLLWPDDQTVTAVVSGAPHIAVLTDYTAARLPGYMRPTSVHGISAMPLTVNGKVDRLALRTWLHDRTRPCPTHVNRTESRGEQC